MSEESLRSTLPRDALASVVVFLVALPLCMGVAIASGMPPAKGLITGIVGGLVVGALAGAPLQVSGPAAGLAGVLVYTGVKLVDLKALRSLGRYGRMPMFVYAATALAILFTDLLSGVLAGFALTLAKLAWSASRLKVQLIQGDDGRAELRMVGAATFLKVPQLARALAAVRPGSELHVPLDRLTYIDHACMELLDEWRAANEAKGCRLVIEPRALRRRLEGRRRTNAALGGARGAA